MTADHENWRFRPQRLREGSGEHSGLAIRSPPTPLGRADLPLAPTLPQ